MAEEVAGAEESATLQPSKTDTYSSPSGLKSGKSSDNIVKPRSRPPIASSCSRGITGTKPSRTMSPNNDKSSKVKPKVPITSTYARGITGVSPSRTRSPDNDRGTSQSNDINEPVKSCYFDVILKFSAL